MKIVKNASCLLFCLSSLWERLDQAFFPKSLMMGITIILFIVIPIYTQAEDAESQAESLKISGDVKLRLRNITHSDVALPVGIFGETLKKGQKLNYRMILEIERVITERLSAGGMIRLSNEDRIAFETGPERLSNDRGSVFVKYNPGYFSTTFGYYNIYFSPLTLMRWDMEDNPEDGGRSSCACLSEGGAITSESLEELGPDITFEGCKLNASISDHIDTVALFARPRVAQEGKTFEQYLYGANFRLLTYHKPSNSFKWLGIKAIIINDDKTSVSDPSRLIYPPVKEKIYSLDFNLPVIKTFLFKGEFALSDSPAENDEAVIGYAAIIGISARYPDRMLTSAAYLIIDPDYRSFYKALSYESNRHGLRISSSYEFIKNKLYLWLFYKWLRELESVIKNEPDLLKTQSSMSFGASLTPVRDLSIKTNYIFESSQRDKGADIAESKYSKHSVNAEVIYNLAHQSSISLIYQYIMHRDKIAREADCNARILSILVSSGF